MNNFLNVVVMMMFPTVYVAGVNHDIIQRAQEDGGNKTVNGTATTNARVPYVSRITAMVSHVTPAQPGPYGWTTNPFAAAAADAQSSATSVSLSVGMEALHIPSATPASTSSLAVPQNQMDSLPMDFPTGGRTSRWGTFVEDRHASFLWNLKYRGFTLQQWMRYFAQYSLWEWSTLCAQTEAQGQLWTDVEWYEYFQQHFYSWSSLVWCLCFLHISPDTARRMISVQYFDGSRRDFRDDSHGSDGGSSSSCL